MFNNQKSGVTKRTKNFHQRRIFSKTDVHRIEMKNLIFVRVQYIYIYIFFFDAQSKNHTSHKCSHPPPHLGANSLPTSKARSTLRKVSAFDDMGRWTPHVEGCYQVEPPTSCKLEVGVK